MEQKRKGPSENEVVQPNRTKVDEYKFYEIEISILLFCHFLTKIFFDIRMDSILLFAMVIIQYLCIVKSNHIMNRILEECNN